jgi:hypothetical protein
MLALTILTAHTPRNLHDAHARQFIIIGACAVAELAPPPSWRELSDGPVVDLDVDDDERSSQRGFLHPRHLRIGSGVALRPQ